MTYIKETRGRPPTTTTKILNHLTDGNWHTIPHNPPNHSALHRLKKQGIIQTHPKGHGPNHPAQYRLTP